MSRSRILFHMVRADFLERVRRYSFLVTLVFSAFLVYAIFSGKIDLRFDHYDGVPNSAWLGAVVGLVSSVFLSLIGFYVVKNTVQRDRETRVGRILAATPMSGSFYTISKALSNFAVLAAMVMTIAAGALILQWVHRGAGKVDLFALLSPLLLFSLCALSVTSALAVLFETVPWLRGGLGNVLYFFLWCFLVSMSVTALTTGRAPGPLALIEDYTGIASISGQMQSQLRELDPQYKGGSSFSVGPLPGATKTFVWDGLNLRPAIVLGRIVWIGSAFCLTLLAAAFFDRFDPARERLNGKPGRENTALPKSGELAESSLRGTKAASVSNLTPLARGKGNNRFVALVLAELRLILNRQPWWWYAVAVGLFAGCLFSPLVVARSAIILVAWIWPMLLWSELGTRETKFHTQALIFSAANAFPRQLLASWTAGVLVTAFTGGGLCLHLLLARDVDGLFAWTAAALFIPALALALGVITESRKPFEALYTVWWYVGALHHIRLLDFIGTEPLSSTPVPYLGLAMTLFIAACLWRKVRFSLA